MERWSNFQKSAIVTAFRELRASNIFATVQKLSCCLTCAHGDLSPQHTPYLFFHVQDEDCCIETGNLLEQWQQHTEPELPTQWTIPQEFDVPWPVPSLTMPSTLPVATETLVDSNAGHSTNTSCTSSDALYEGRIEGLNLSHAHSYAVEVRAYDKANNLVEGCGVSISRSSDASEIVEGSCGFSGSGASSVPSPVETR